MRVRQGGTRVRRAAARFAVRYGTIGVALLVVVIAVGVAWLTLSVAPDNVKETWQQRLALVIGGWSVAGGGIWLTDYLWHKIKGVHQVLSRKERELNRQEGREAGREEGRLLGLDEGRQEGRLEGRQEGRQEGVAIRNAQLLEFLEEHPETTLDQIRELLRNGESRRQ